MTETTTNNASLSSFIDLFSLIFCEHFRSNFLLHSILSVSSFCCCCWWYMCRIVMLFLLFNSLWINWLHMNQSTQYKFIIIHFYSFLFRIGTHVIKIIALYLCVYVFVFDTQQYRIVLPFIISLFGSIKLKFLWMSSSLQLSVYGKTHIQQSSIEIYCVLSSHLIWFLDFFFFALCGVWYNTLWRSTSFQQCVVNNLFVFSFVF